MKIIPLVLFVQTIVLPGANAYADIVTLKDGSKITGAVEIGYTSEIRIRVGEDSQRISIEKIRSIQFDPIDAPEPASVSVAPAPVPVAQPTVSVAPQPVSPPAPVARTPVEGPTAAPQGITLPIGTEIAVRTIKRIDSKTADKYTEYAASLDDPVVVDGVTVVPVNADAILRVSEIQSSGITRRASLSMSLIAVIVDGRRVEVKTGPVDSKSGSQAKRTATGAAVGAGAGAAVGAMAGGAVGAAVGAGVGAAAGTAVAVVKGKPVEIAPETRFTYKLTEPVAINAQESPR